MDNNIDNKTLSLSDYLALVRQCTNKDGRISIRTSRAFHNLVDYLVKERGLTGEADLIEKSILYYSGILETYNKKQHIMTDAELDITKPKRIRLYGKATGLLNYRRVFGNDFQQSILNKGERKWNHQKQFPK